MRRYVDRESSSRNSNDFQDALRMLLVGIDTWFHTIDDGLIDYELAVLADDHLEAIHRTRRRSFEVQAGHVVTRAVTRTLELLLRGKPSRGASEMRALGEDRVETGFGANDPG